MQRVFKKYLLNGWMSWVNGEKKEQNLDEIEDILGIQMFPSVFKEELQTINKPITIKEIIPMAN